MRAAAGLAGGVTAEKSAGTGYASAQAGPHAASSGLVRDNYIDKALAKQRRKEEKLRRKELKKQREALRRVYVEKQ